MDTWTNASVHIHVNEYEHMYIHTHVYTHTYNYACVIHEHIRTYAHTVDINSHIHSHKHTQKRRHINSETNSEAHTCIHVVYHQCSHNCSVVFCFWTRFFACPEYFLLFRKKRGPCTDRRCRHNSLCWCNHRQNGNYLNPNWIPKLQPNVCRPARYMARKQLWEENKIQLLEMYSRIRNHASC